MQETLVQLFKVHFFIFNLQYIYIGIKKFQVRINTLQIWPKIYKNIKKNRKMLINDFIKVLLKILKLETKGKRFSFVLTGGPSPIKLYEALSNQNFLEQNVDFFGVMKDLYQKIKISNFKLA